MAALASMLAVAQEQPPKTVAPSEPRPSGLTEVQEVRRVQIDVSVIDPRHNELSSVPGLPRDVFELRVDNARLPPDVEARVEFDEICPSPDGSGSIAERVALADDRPTIIVVADMNFLDVRMRHAVGRAISQLADMATRQPLRVKVLAYSRQLIPLTPDFTSDPSVIDLAGRALSGVMVPGPSIGGLSAAPPRDRSRAQINPTPMSDQTDTSQPTDPDVPTTAFDLQMTQPSQTFAAKLSLPYTETKLAEASFLGVDPRPSLSALESVLISHAAIRGRKALVLFTSSWFELPDELRMSYLAGIRDAAQGGFTIWTVDARGLVGGPGSYRSRVLGFLASATGGDVISSAGRLSIAFDRALSQLSCYYLFSIPIASPQEGAREHSIDVRIDTEKHPEYWRYRVRTVSGVTLLDPTRDRTRRRVAALMSPDAYRYPEVRVTATYPRGPSRITTVEVATLLSDLHFAPQRDRAGFAARIALDGSVVDQSGRTVCRIGDGVARMIRSEQPPAKFPPSLLVIASRCALPGPGQYDVRAIVQDLGTEDIGSGMVHLEFAAVRPALPKLSALRLGRNSGRDFLLDLDASRGVTEIASDRERRAFVPLTPGEPIVSADRLMIRFVVCGASSVPSLVFFERRNENHPPPQVLADAPVPSIVPLGMLEGGATTCREFQAVVAENTLPPGDYGLAVVEPPDSRAATPGAEGHQLGTIELRVVPPVPAPQEQKKDKA